MTTGQDRHHRHSASQPPEVTCGHPSHRVAGPAAPTYTPGPWEARSYRQDGVVFVVPLDACDGFAVCELVRPDKMANARLIAAAPELLALLLEEYDDRTQDTGRADRERRARALLERLTPAAAGS